MVWLAAILLVAWLLGWGVFHVAGGLIHLLLVVAFIGSVNPSGGSASSFVPVEHALRAIIGTWL